MGLDTPVPIVRPVGALALFEVRSGATEGPTGLKPPSRRIHALRSRLGL
jgi:hypothetical protein